MNCWPRYRIIRYHATEDDVQIRSGSTLAKLPCKLYYPFIHCKYITEVLMGVGKRSSPSKRLNGLAMKDRVLQGVFERRPLGKDG